MNPFEDLAQIELVVRSILPTAEHLQVERVAQGVSTIVYRVGCSAHTCYLRICPDPGVSLVAEGAVYRCLGNQGLHVPTVLHLDPHQPLLQRSLMLTTAIPGHAIGYFRPPASAPAIVRAAGRELARINQVRVQGYGWLNHLVPATGELAAEYPSLPEWLHAHFAASFAALAGVDNLPRQTAARLVALLDVACNRFRDEAAVLAHGDFDVTHIFYRGNAYTGIIDFGEIRGAHWLYDLGHFAIENERLLPDLLAGYQEVSPYPAAGMWDLRLTSLLIAARRIGRRVQQQRRPHPPDVAYVMTQLAAFDQDERGVDS